MPDELKERNIIRGCSIHKGPQFVYDGDSQIWLKDNEAKKLRYIRHTFQFCPIKAVDDADEKKVVTKIFPDGIVEISEYSGKKETSSIRKRVSNEELGDLINHLNTCDYYNYYCDAMSYVSFVFEDGKFRHFDSTPECLEEFVHRLEYNTHYVIKVDV